MKRTNQDLGNIAITNSSFQNEIDIHSTGGSLMNEMLVRDNVFEGSQYGFLADGDNWFDIIRNDFIGNSIGGFVHSSGYDLNVHSENNFSNNAYGIHANEINDDYSFVNNCFQTIGEDVNVNGTLASDIGYEELGAGNCFTGGAITDLNISASISDINYFLPQGEYNTCHEPKYDSDYILTNSDVLGDKSCGSSIWTPIDPGLIEPTGCFTYRTCTDISAGITSILSQLEEIENNTLLSDVIKDGLKAPLLNCLRQLYVREAVICRVEAAGPYHELGIQSHEDFDMRSKYIGILIGMGEYQEALDYLAIINPQTEEANDYVSTQLINIRRLIEGDLFVISQQEIQDIYQIGMKKHPLSAYARGLYTILTNEVIYPQPDFAAATTPRSLEYEASTDYQAHPNPFSHNLKITAAENVVINIYNVFGVKVISMTSNSNTIDVNTTDWKSGVYIVEMQNQGSGIYQSVKVVK